MTQWNLVHRYQHFKQTFSVRYFRHSEQLDVSEKHVALIFGVD
jgi:hypothetical protein